MPSRRRNKRFRHAMDRSPANRSAFRRPGLEWLERRLLLSADSGSSGPLEEPAVVVGEIIVGFEGEIVAAYQQDGFIALEESVDAIVGDAVLFDPVVLAILPATPNQSASLTTRWMVVGNADVSDLMAPLTASPDVAFAEPNFVLLDTAAFPNDSRFGEQWSLNNTGQTGGTVDADIDAPEAWELVTGNSDVVVGLIDSGVDYTHPDLASNIWTNPGEIPDDGLDNDGNGYVDDFYGWDFVNGDNDPLDDNGHGTHVAGTLAAIGNNANGVTGVAWNSKIMALKFLNSSGVGSIAGAVAAMSYATSMCERGVNIRMTNNSWGGGGYSQALADAIEASAQCDMLFLASVGNKNADTDVTPSYPASYNLDNVIAVAASDGNDTKAAFSDFGSTSVDLAAPGVGILSTARGGGYSVKSGTSMAVPHVSGVAALAWSAVPDASYQQVRDAILGGADAIASMAGTSVTGGRLNALGALTALTTYEALGSPMSIPDESTITSTLTVPNEFEISDVNVEIDITHATDQDLDVFLIAPDGTRVELFTDVGINGNNFTSTTLDDQASTSITSGFAPFSGGFRPEGSLATLDGMQAQGTWTLEVTDDKQRYAGTLNHWSLQLGVKIPPLPVVSIDDVQVVEGDSGTSTFVFTVTRSGLTNRSSAVSFTTVGNTANSASDFQSTSGMLSFAVGEVAKTIVVTVNGDTIPEQDETFYVDLAIVDNGEFGDSRGVGTIVNDDGGPVEPSVSISDVTVLEDSTLKIAHETGGGPTLYGEYNFGESIAALGDLDGDGIGDMAVGSRAKQIHILFLNADGTAKSFTTIGSDIGGGPTFDSEDRFGISLANLGDVDGDGVTDLAVGAPYGLEGGLRPGAVYVLFLNTDGTVKGSTKIGQGIGGGPSQLAHLDRFGQEVSALGDLDGDGISELAVGATRDDTGGPSRGAVYVLFLNADGTAKGITKINDAVAGISLEDNAQFGESIVALGDLDGPAGPSDFAIAIGATNSANDGDYGPDRGAAIHVVFLDVDEINSTVSIVGTTKIADSTGAPTLFDVGLFGYSLTSLGDIDGNGTMDLAVGGGDGTYGGVHIITLHPDGTVKDSNHITRNPATIDGDGFGKSIANIGDRNGDDVPDLAVGAWLDDTGRGAVHLVYLNADRTAKGNHTMSLTVTRHVGTSGTSTVNFSTADGSAAGGIDYVGTSGTLEFAPGVSQQSVLVTLLNNQILDGDKTFTVDLSGAVGATIADAQATVTIVDDEVQRQISISDATVTKGDTRAHYRGNFIDGGFEGQTFGPDGSYYVTVNNVISRYDGVTGEYLGVFAEGYLVFQCIRDLEFNDGYLYVASGCTDEVVRLDGTTGKFVDVFVAAGSGGIDEPQELVFGPDANDDGVPELYVSGRSSSNVVRYDGVSGQPLGSYVASNSGGLDLPGGITFDPTGSSLLVASTRSGKVLKYDALTGASLGVVTPDLYPYVPKDVDFGADGLLYVIDSGGRILRFTADGTYVDDYIPSGTIEMENPTSFAFGPDGDVYVTGLYFREVMRFGTESEIVFTVNLSEEDELPVSVDYTTVDVTASAGDGDYVAISGTLTFQPGQTSKTILIPILDDGSAEGNETFDVALSNPINATIGDGQGQATITEALAGVTITPLTEAVTSEGGGEARFRVVLDSQPSGPVTLRFSTSDPTEGLVASATEPSSFDDDLYLPFNPLDWYKPKDIIVAGVDDSDYDPDVSYEIIVTVADSVDPYYYDYEPDDIQLTNIDDENGPGSNELPSAKFYVVDGGVNQSFEYSDDGTMLDGNQWNLDGGNSNPRGATSISDGSRVWIVDSNRNVYVYDGDGALQTSGAASGLNQPEGIATDGTHVWIVDRKAKQVLRYDDAAVAGDWTPDFSFSLSGANSSAMGIATDGASIWIVDDGRRTDQVFKYRASDGALLGNWAIADQNSKPTGIANDPSGASASLWIVDNGTDQVFEYGNALADAGGSLVNVFSLAPANTNPQGIADPMTSFSGANQLPAPQIHVAASSPAGVDSIGYRNGGLQIHESFASAIPTTHGGRIVSAAIFDAHRPSLKRYAGLPIADEADRVFAEPSFNALDELGALEDDITEINRTSLRSS